MSCYCAHSRALIAIVFCCLCGVVASARDKSDVIYMKNGDRLTCEIKGLDSATLYVSMDYLLGTQSVEWSKIERLESKQLFIVKTDDGRSYTGTLSTVMAAAPGPAMLQVLESADQSVILSERQIVQIAETSETFWKRLNGSVSSGIIYSRGNQNTQYSLSSEVTYPRQRWVAAAYANSTLSSNTGDTISTRNNFGGEVRRFLPYNNWFYAVQSDFLQSSEQGIKLQTTVDSAIGKYIKNTNRTKLSLLAGIGWQHIGYKQSDENVPQQNVAAALFGAHVNIFRFNKTNFDVTAAVWPALSQPGRVHFDTNTAYYVKLFSNLTWNISFYGNWDTQPPHGFSGSDYGTSSGLGWTFGTR